MKIHILGICGTFMGGLALLAKELGYEVTGSDKAAYPPMSDQLRAQGITIEPYSIEALKAKDLIVIGNALSRGNLAVEYILEHRLPFTSGPEWLYQHILKNRWVLAVAGTHGKTTTTSMLAWILQHQGLSPGFLIGGVANNFGVSASLGEAPYFVIEADEYDTAFFDKRSKFLHYWPRTAVINNLEYDHADIFPDLTAIQKQFRYFLRTVPKNGRVIYFKQPSIEAVLKQEPYVETIALEPSQMNFTLECGLFGEHNTQNAFAAMVAAEQVGVSREKSIEALKEFKGVKRRLELKAEHNGMCVYEDFAHHPTAIQATLQALRTKVGKDKRIIATVEVGTHTMSLGQHKEALQRALMAADEVHLYATRSLGWDLHSIVGAKVHEDIGKIAKMITENLKAQDQIIVMSNGKSDELVCALSQGIYAAR